MRILRISPSLPTNRGPTRPAGSSPAAAALPSSAMRASADRPSAPIRWNRISRLLAAQLGPSSPGPAVSTRSPVPSGLTMPIRRPSWPRRVKAIHSPSGLHCGRGIPAAAEADPALAAAVGVHHVELLRSAAVAFEDDLAAVGREARVGVDARRGGQPLRRAAARAGDIDVAVGADHHREGDPVAVGREARREASSRRRAAAADPGSSRDRTDATFGLAAGEADVSEPRSPSAPAAASAPSRRRRSGSDGCSRRCPSPRCAGCGRRRRRFRRHRRSCVSNMPGAPVIAV